MRHLISLSLACLLAIASMAACRAATLEVQQGASIQDAVNAAKPGWTVHIHAGTYSQSVRIPFDESYTTHNIQIVGDPGAVLDGSMLEGQTGINILSSKGNTVSGLTVRNFAIGISIASPGKITDNTVTNCGIGLYASVIGDGIHLPKQTSLNNNLVVANNEGIELDACQNVSAKQNTVICNGLGIDGAGISVQQCDQCAVSQNIVSANGKGIYAFFTSSTTFEQNVALGNQGLDLEDSSGDQNVWSQNIYLHGSI